MGAKKVNIISLSVRFIIGFVWLSFWSLISIGLMIICLPFRNLRIKLGNLTGKIFGPVVTIYVFDDNKWEETLQLVDETSGYALTGAVFSEDRYALEIAVRALEDAAGNFYINDKPTGAVVGQQPFGGARASGTNDKAGSKLNLYRWVSPRMVKETFVSPIDYKYPFLG